MEKCRPEERKRRYYRSARVSTKWVGLQLHLDPAGQHSAFSEGLGADWTGERREAQKSSSFNILRTGRFILDAVR